MDNNNHFLKKISGWHYVYVILILILTIVGIVAYYYSDKKDFVSLVSFAATISSIILSVLAIIFTVVSGESTNRLRDGLFDLRRIPEEVSMAINSTIKSLQQSTKDMNLSTAENKKVTENLTKELDTKIQQLEIHLQQKLNEHSSQLAVINELVSKNKPSSNGSNSLNGSSSNVASFEDFVSVTSYYSLLLLKVIHRYCDNKNKTNNEPVVQISILSQKINKGVADYGIDMYIIACVVLLDAMRYIRYLPIADSLTHVKFISINDELIQKVDDELKKRDSRYVDNNDAIQYIDSLFNNTNNAEDGSSIEENS